jgi:hypothetical protein
MESEGVPDSVETQAQGRDLLVTQHNAALSIILVMGSFP